MTDSMTTTTKNIITSAIAGMNREGSITEYRTKVEKKYDKKLKRPAWKITVQSWDVYETRKTEKQGMLHDPLDILMLCKALNVQSYICPDYDTKEPSIHIY